MENSMIFMLFKQPKEREHHQKSEREFSGGNREYPNVVDVARLHIGF